jgi:RNA polymerase sigma-70 factor, ECF subfamily
MVGIPQWRTAPPAAWPGEAGEGPVREAHLLRAAQAGDDVALEALLAPHERRLYVLCRGILEHAQDAEDAVQETFLRALMALPRFRGDAPVRAWLFRIAVNVCLEWKRSHHSTEPWEAADASIPSNADSPEVIVLRQMRVMEALRSLLPRHRAILLLKELEGWSLAEIATALRWNTDRVKNELARARRALADWRERAAGQGDEL